MPTNTNMVSWEDEEKGTTPTILSEVLLLLCIRTGSVPYVICSETTDRRSCHTGRWAESLVTLENEKARLPANLSLQTARTLLDIDSEAIKQR